MRLPSYGPPKTIPSVSYFQAMDPHALPAGFFSNKVVCVGARLLTVFSGQRKDEYRTPHSNWAASTALSSRPVFTVPLARS